MMIVSFLVVLAVALVLLCHLENERLKIQAQAERWVAENPERVV